MTSYYIYRFNVRMAIFTIVFLLFSNAIALQADTPQPLLRQPDIHGNTVIFVHGDDIWSAPVGGGIATRLTIHEGVERNPKFSPSGDKIAFTAQYDGNTDVYVMNVHGGDIRRVTFHPGRDEVVGWHPAANKIIFRSARNSYGRYTRLFMISPEGTGLEEIELHEAAQGSFSKDGRRIAYNRVAREHRTWKRYRGGLAQDIYLHDMVSKKERKLTTYDGTDRLPMWYGEKIYFSSDRDRVLNIYAYDLETDTVTRITQHAGYDVRYPEIGGAHIVYESGGSIMDLDIESGTSRRIPIEIRTDSPETRPYHAKVKDFVTAADCSPDGKHALIVARGEIFSVPAGRGTTRNLSSDCGSRDKDAAWSPDGSRIAFFSDRGGEYDIYITPADGSGEPRRLTKHSDGYRHTIRWSPDGKKLAFADQTLRCFWVDAGSGKITEIDKSDYENVDVALDNKLISDYSWSPDSRFIAYTKMDADLVYKLYIYSLETGKKHCVSSGIFNDFNPVFSRDGLRLFFYSNRRFDPTFCDFEWEMVYKDVAGIYCLTLQKETGPLLPFGERESEKGRKTENTDAAKRIEIDFDGIAGRIEHLPLSPGNYRSLTAGDGVLFYLNKDEGDFNRFDYRVVRTMDLYAFEFETREERSVIKDISEYSLSGDASKIVYRKNHDVGIIPCSAVDSKGKDLNLSDLSMRMEPLREWTQIYNEAWRMERDFYYEPDMHGQSWTSVKEKYGSLLPFAVCRSDVAYLIGEMIGELNTSHTYVFGGERRREAERVSVGMLGVDWTADAGAGRYRFEKIYRVPDWTNEILPPLAIPGLLVKEGDYLIAVNGTDVTTDRNIYSYLEGHAGKSVDITINSSPSNDGARTYAVNTLGSERTLRYLDWVERNRLLAERESGGTIGYIHLPDTYLGSAREFPKYFYAQTRKKGLIIDGRFNGGGLDPDIFLQRLRKEPLSYWTRRYSHDQTVPAVSTRAHMACITNRQAGSGGDMLPMEFRMNKMGPIIGTRTWGGLVGVSMFISMIDGGMLTAPDYRIYTPSGKWIVENEGVAPDIEVDLDPAQMAGGNDAQLMKAIEYLKNKIAAEPREWPKHEAFPVDRD